MNVHKIVTNYLDENCYIITKDNKSLIIDPGVSNNEIINYIDKNKLNICGFLITHNHFDHIASLKKLLKLYNNEIVDINNKKIIDGFNYEIIETKGHTNDSISFYFKEENIIFTGDFLFKGTIGRYDFETSSEEEMKKSIELIKKYDKKVKIHPGHGEETTLEEELVNNIYLRDLC